MKYVFLDLDGTISDSSEGITNCIAEALEQMGVPVEDKASLKKYIGPPLSVSFRDYFEGERVEEAIGRYRALYRVSGWKENRMYPGIPEALARLQGQGKRLVMATSKPEEFARRIAEYFGIAPYFTAICGASMDQTVNTKAEVIAYAMKTLGLTGPEDIVMVGDRHHDVEGAAEFGIATLGVTYGFGTAEELLTAGAFAVADTPEEMSRMLLAL